MGDSVSGRASTFGTIHAQALQLLTEAPSTHASPEAASGIKKMSKQCFESGKLIMIGGNRLSRRKLDQPSKLNRTHEYSAPV